MRPKGSPKGGSTAWDLLGRSMSILVVMRFSNPYRLEKPTQLLKIYTFLQRLWQGGCVIIVLAGKLVIPRGAHP